MDFKPDNHHVVTVNRDPQQYTGTSTDEDIRKLNDLLDLWAKDPYDHYHEWLSETADMLRKIRKDG